mmetsp:Transcript_35218/g.71940  ORF Transcript_35218/g.71940 Transcript_35218/m.71940 type:complete len:474 (+) Transcript_35218:117-1538(+)
MTSILYISGRQLRRSMCTKPSLTSFQHIICTNTARPIIIHQSSLFSSSNTSNDDEKNSSRESAASESIDTNDATNNDNNDSTTTTSLPSPPKSNISNLAELSKARLSALVVSTTAFGFMSVGPTALAYTSLPTFAAASIGTALCASSAATFNQVIEIERDSKMKRTGNRPLVNGSVSKQAAIGLGCLTGSTGGILLGLGTDPITTMLGVGNIGLYAGLYTYLKPRSEINTWVGAVVGAIPPVMGWTAAGGSILDPEAVLLGSTLFLWQFPHFFALNWMYRTDYKRGGFSMVAVNDPNGDRTASLIKRYGVYLASLPFLSTALEVTSPMFAVEGILLNGYALHVASKFDKERSNSNARKVFLTSLWYLPCVMMLFLLHSRRWHEEVTNDEKDETILDSFQKLMSKIQAKGKELCMHEALVSKEVEVSIGEGENKTSLDGSKCPISMTKNAQISIGTGKEEVTLPLEEDPTSDER